MSDDPFAVRPRKLRSNLLQTESVPISFASPQQLAQFAAGGGSFFNAHRMPAPYQTYRPPMNMANNFNNQMQPVPMIPNYATASASPSTSTEKKPLKPLPAQPIDLSTFKGFGFAYLDSLQMETREIYDEISGTFIWEMFGYQHERCVTYVRDDFKNKRVFLISSGSLGEKVVPQIHDLSQLYAIYIYCTDVKYHGDWARKYSKVRVVCDDDDRYLLPQFAVDVAQSNIDWGNALFQQGTRDKAKEKFKLAYDKVNKYAPNHDQAMDVELKNNLEKCN